MPKLYTPRDAAQVLGISYASLKQWIYQGKLKSIQTPGGHHRIPESEIDRVMPRVTVKGAPEKRRRTFRRIRSLARSAGSTSPPSSPSRRSASCGSRRARSPPP
jgi:excisionase family DNA binding protein